MNIVSDEIVEKAAGVFNSEYSFTFEDSPLEALRAVLEAVADDLVIAEREACAKICDDEDQVIASCGRYDNWAMREDALKFAAAAIRARTTKE